jgi:hypothetical protein
MSTTLQQFLSCFDGINFFLRNQESKTGWNERKLGNHATSERMWTKSKMVETLPTLNRHVNESLSPCIGKHFRLPQVTTSQTNDRHQLPKRK